VSALLDKGANPKSPPLQGRGKGWGLSQEQLATLNQRAREMRNNPPEPELRLWRNLSNGQLAGYKFRRQQVIGRAIVDFYCPSARLAVEVDGDTHADPAREARRDAYLRQFGLTVLHVSNPDVMQNMDGVLQSILSALQSPPLQGRGRSREAAEGVGPVACATSYDSPHPNPSPEGEGLVAVEAQKLLAISLEGSVG
jgi:very-short-patch-repair endonuclease